MQQGTMAKHCPRQEKKRKASPTRTQSLMSYIRRGGYVVWYGAWCRAVVNQALMNVDKWEDLGLEWQGSMWLGWGEGAGMGGGVAAFSADMTTRCDWQYPHLLYLMRPWACFLNWNLANMAVVWSCFFSIKGSCVWSIVYMSMRFMLKKE